jgi:predicted mannosyl-3-phosphoglycerate phosphatase (HAD superfamily)
MSKRDDVGGVVHVYQKYNPVEFPSPLAESPDLVSNAFEHALAYGNYRELTEEELARAVHLDPSQIAGFGPSIEALRAMLEERKRKILETYQVDGLDKRAQDRFEKQSRRVRPPAKLKGSFDRAIRQQQIYLLEQIWYMADRSDPSFASDVLGVMESLGDKYQIDELLSKYIFTGRERLDIPQAIEVKKELEKIDELLKQLEEAAKTAQIALIDMEALAEFAPAQDLNNLEEIRNQINNLVRELAERQGLERNESGGFRLTPKAYKTFQAQLLERIFSNLQASRSGRHAGRIIGDGSVELPSTKAYEFGDSIANVDVVQSVVNAMLRRPNERPVRLSGDDLEVFKTRKFPQMRYRGYH